MKRAFIIHGWDGNPQEGWFPWLKKELDSRGWKTAVPAMPEPDWPKIEAWVKHIATEVGSVDEQTYFVGHSIGCQAIIRYLMTLSFGARIGGAVFVAGWTKLTPAAVDGAHNRLIAAPWLEQPIIWPVIRQMCPKSLAVFSDNDDMVPISETEVFKRQLGSEVKILNGSKHFSGTDGVLSLPIVRDWLISREPA